jgi:hypothetical protein
VRAPSEHVFTEAFAPKKALFKGRFTLIKPMAGTKSIKFDGFLEELLQICGRSPHGGRGLKGFVLTFGCYNL